MTVVLPGARAVGARVARLEDDRLLRGAGRFVDDVDRPGQLWMRVVRSAVAHAAIGAVDCDEARELSGVRAVLCAADIVALPRIPLRLGQLDPPLDRFLQPVLADGHVRYVGEPVAVVVAEDPYVAEDAAELVRVHYEPLEPVLDAATAADTDARAALLARRHGDIQAAFARADRVVEVELRVGRHSAVPLETRGLVADYDHIGDRLTLWGITKVAHFNRFALASMLNIAEHRITVRTTDAGGGFGVRGELYPEDFLVAFLARRLRRPVKWIEDRSEHLVAANQSREQSRRLIGAFARDGELLAIRDEVFMDQGAYVRTVGGVVGEVTLSMLPGPYRVPAYEGTLHLVVTNKTPAGTYRSPGRYESTFACERLLDQAARELALDPVELRRRNLLCSEDMPHRRTLPILGHDIEIDAGDPCALLEQTLAAADYATWMEEAREARATGRLVGVGVACFLEKGGGGGFETATVEIGRDGRVRVGTGGAALGQGGETMLAQVVADELSIPPGDVEVLLGDTDLVSTGVGSWASRSTVFGGSAAQRAAAELAERVRALASELGGPGDRSLAAVAAACDPLRAARDGAPAELRVTRSYADAGMTYPYGVQIAQVEIDQETGIVTVLKAFVGCEVGRAINPTLVEGQLVGGFVQGLGGALMEEFLYDEFGEPLSASFMSYRLPTAAEAPVVGTLIREDFRSAGNPLGAKGCGEAGIIASGAALAAAVDDALGACAVRRLPMTPERVLTLIDAR